MKLSTSTASALFAALALFAPPSTAHSWIEQMNVIDANGNYTGNPGYPRGYVMRATPGFGDALMVNLIPPNAANRIRVDNTDPVCKSTQQQVNSNPPQFPQLRASPGDYVAMKYLENGHVSLPFNQKGKEGSGGLVYVYATTNPQPNQKLLDVLAWNFSDPLDQGRLLAIQNFDDGRCYQKNGAPISQDRQKEFPDVPAGQPATATVEQWCESNIQVPKDATKGTLTVYWVWQWPTLPGMDPGIPTGKDETYTTCSDFQIVTNGTSKFAVNNQIQKLIQQDPQMKAVENYKERAANQTLPNNPMFLGPNNPTPSSPSGGQIGGSITTAAHSTAAPTTRSPSVSVSVRTTTFTTMVTVTKEVTVGAAGPTGGPTAGASKRHVQQHARSLRFHA